MGYIIIHRPCSTAIKDVSLLKKALEIFKKNRMRVSKVQAAGGNHDTTSDDQVGGSGTGTGDGGSGCDGGSGEGGIE